MSVLAHSDIRKARKHTFAALRELSRFMLNEDYALGYEMNYHPPKQNGDNNDIWRGRVTTKPYDLVYLIGGDSLRDFPAWKKPDQILSACDTIGVMARPGDMIDMDALDREIPGIRSKVSWIDAPLIEISASAIRERIKLGEPVKYYLPAGVYELIQEFGLYKDK